MASLKHIVSKLHRKNSKSHVFFLVLVLIMFLLIAGTVRYYVLEPVRSSDSSMHPKHKEHKTLWMCKLPQCIDMLKFGESAWVKLRNGETLVRKLIAMPGDTIEITDNGKVYTPHMNFKWRGESAFIEKRKIYMPKRGDTLTISELNDVEQDYLISLMQEQGMDFFLKTTLWQGDREISIDRVGSTKLANRQVSLQEVDQLPWQDRRLVEMQIRQNEPGNALIKLKRELYNKADSTLIEQVVINKDCYYFICERPTHCADSREYGFFTHERILGRHETIPDKVVEAITKASKFVLKKFDFLKKTKVFKSESSPETKGMKSNPHPKAKTILKEKNTEKNK